MTPIHSSINVWSIRFDFFDKCEKMCGEQMFYFFGMLMLHCRKVNYQKSYEKNHNFESSSTAVWLELLSAKYHFMENIRTFKWMFVNYNFVIKLATFRITFPFFKFIFALIVSRPLNWRIKLDIAIFWRTTSNS